MKAQADKASHFHRAGAARGVLPLLITGIAIILFSTAGVARMMGWGPNSTEDAGGILALDQTATDPTAGEASTKPRCSECGVIVSMREIEKHDEGSGPGAAGGAAARSRDETRVNSTKGGGINVRMADGSRRVIEDANPARWRTGERLIVIDGVGPPYR